jgi:hypothetical protein
MSKMVVAALICYTVGSIFFVIGSMLMLLKELSQ